MFSLDFLLPPLMGAATFTRDDIESLVSKAQCQKAKDQRFVGKPGTQVFTDGRVLVKLLPVESGPDSGGVDEQRQRLKSQRLRDLQLGIYPPEKTWFLLQSESAEFRTGNVTRLHIPLHQSHLLGDASEKQWNMAIAQACFMTLQMAAEHDVMLDAGLSNFVATDDDQVFYVDDDVYTCDNYRLFGQIIAGYLRTYVQVDADYLGQQIGKACSDFFDGDQAVAKQLIHAVTHTYIPPNRIGAFEQFYSAFVSAAELPTDEYPSAFCYEEVLI